MKRFTLFLCSLLLAVFAMAQSETKSLTVNPTEGSFYRDGSTATTTAWASTWTSSSEEYPVVTISTTLNNIWPTTVDTDGFKLAAGNNGCTYTLSVADCMIKAYSFKFISSVSGSNVTITPTGGTAMTSSDEEQTLSVEDINAATATFAFSSGNNAVKITEFSITVATSPFTTGSVYHFQNIGNTAVALSASALNDVAAVTSNKESTSQQWYCEKVDGYYTFRNLSNGKYLKGNGASGGWSLTDDYSDGANKFIVVFPETQTNDDAEGYTIYSSSHNKGDSGGGGSMHRDNGNNIVGWGSYNSNTRWTITTVDYTEDQLAANWERVAELTPNAETVTKYEDALKAIFTDAACTILNSAYTTTSMTDEQLAANANYSALPQTLRDMVKKVRGGNWAEETVALDARPNGNNSSHGQWDVYTTWEDAYARKFRVQMYEPYSVEGEITSYLRFNAHCNMDNPTGIYANSNQAIYIMVEGAIEEGAELWLAHQTGHGATSYYNNSVYTQLHEGLNVVPYFTDGCQMWINYVVHTYNSSGTDIETKFPHKLSDYKPLKIHIEGGYINGFFNAMGDFRSTEVSGDANGGENLWGEVDNDADWDYYKARAALATDFALLGHRQTLLFDFGTWNSTNGYFGVANDGGGIEKALAWHLENIEVPTTPNCYGGSGKTFGNYTETYYPGMNLDAETGKINIMLEAWDRIMYSEHATMGLLSKSNIDKMNSLYPRWTNEGKAAEIYNYGEATVNDVTETYKEFCQGIDYSEYYNHHGAAVGAASGYMSGGWRVCNYHYNTMGSIIGKIANEAGPTWGPAHEIGHQHQGVFNLNGQTEVTNNFFSNVAVWYMGMGTSRVNGTQGSLASVLDAYNTDNNDLYTNNIWAMTHLYYRLWLYYHLAGKNTQFWPRLFELLRQVPMANGGQISGETSLLRFYQHACTAAGEDLTEFFRAHGFFELMTDRLVGDYSNATYNVTEEQIETAITAVEANKYPKNYAILLINDGTDDTTVKHDGTTNRALWDGSASAEYGSVTDFIEGNTSITDAYDAIVSADGTITMSGGVGGVGFLIFNEDGELVSFSNKSSFEISDEAAYLLATGKATIVAVDAENNTEEAEVDLSAIQREMLGALIAKIEEMPIDDGSYKHAGFYTKSSAEELLAVLDNARTVYNSNSGYGAAYEMLYTAKEEFVNSENHSYVPFDPSLTYIIKSYAYGNTMHLSSGAAVGKNIDETAATTQWQFKTTGTDGIYRLYNTAGYYLTAPAKSAKVGSSSTESDGATFSLLQDSPVGAWTISLSPTEEYGTLHDDSYGKVVGWEAGVNASKWYLTATTDNSSNAPKTDALQALVAKTDALVDLVSEINYTIDNTPVALQTTNDAGDYYVRTNATNTGGGNEGPIANLVDGSTANFFHTQWDNNAISEDNLDHYIEVNMGSGKLTAFNFSYTTRAGVDNDYPQVIKVYGSNTENKTGDESEYILLATISSGLPASSTQSSYNSAAIDAGIAYQYLRFMVPTTNKNRKTGDVQHNYWHMAEFDISAATAVATPRTDYSSIDAAKILAAYNAVNAAKSWMNYANVTDEQITSATSTLQTAYEALKEAYDAVIKVKKDELEALADATDAVVNSVGSVVFGTKTPFTPTATNFYCNSVDGDGGATADNMYNLADGNESTYLHTKTNDHTGEDSYGYHYLRVDLGDGVTTENFMFTYQNRTPSSYAVFPSVLTIQGSNDNSEYVDIVEISSGLPNTVGGTYESEVLGNGNAYRYFRFVVKSTHANRSTPNYFCMAEFSFTAVQEINITIKTAYEGIVSEDLWLSTYHTSGDSHTMAAEDSYATLALLEAQIAKLTAAKATLEAAMNQVNKSELETSLAAINALYSKMADGEGNIASDYTPSALTPEQLTAIKTVIDEAQAVFDYTGATQLEVNNAKTAVDEKYTELLTIEEANINREGSTVDKSELETLITNAAELLSTINGKTENNSDYYAAAGIAIDELQDAYNAAVAANGRYYLTQEQYAEVKEALNNSYTTINPIVAADVADRDELTTLIDNVNTLLGTIAVESAPKNVAVPLQSTTADGNFYIWCNSPAGDDDGVAGLIDKNADGTANTGTFLGTSWGSTVAAYTHYIEVDLGEGITIDKLLFDYTTRNSTHSNQRPTAIKILGSNNKTDYTEITIISEGLATEQCQQWSMAETLGLGAPYRYIRFAVATQESTGYFNMSDFNLYALIGHTRALKEYYTTAEGLELDALCIALQSAEYAANHYLTSDRLTEVKNMLSGYYTTANTIVEADVEAGDRTDLTGLVAETETLIEKVATVTEVEVTLTEGMLYCNADNSTNGSAGDNDKRGVAALLDGDLATHLHTTYGGNAQDDDLDHYIRVDLGESSAVTAFKFNYRGRSSNSNNDPTKMTIQACATTDGDWVTIKELTGLPTDGDAVEYNSELIEMSKPYRYVRFMVTETQNNAYTTYNSIQHKFFVMSEFGFESYPTVEVDENYPRVTTALVRTAYNEKNSANNVATNYYMTESDYTAALAELQDAYDALEAATVVDKTALKELIEATTLLKEQMYEIASYTTNEVTLQNTNENEAGYIYCNAPEKNSSWATDNVGVAALIDLTDGGDPNLDTFLHTEYGSDQSADGLDHYLRVDLGADGATEYIEFGYYGRSGDTAKSPKKVIVAATNDLTDGGVWTTIATLNLAQASASTETKTGCLGNGVAYRYWRFLVKETYHNGKDGNNHPYFCMTQLNVYKYTDVVRSEQLKYTPNIYIYVTDDLVTEVTNAIDAATIVQDNTEATQPAVNAAVEALQPIHDKLEEALKYAGVPVEITTDEENPILYNIIIKRADDGSKVLQYCEFDAENPNTVSVSAKATNSSYQAWYFMESTYGVTIKPFNGEGKVLGADNTSNGHTKVWAVTEGAKSYYEWKFIARTDGYYNIQAHDGSNYFSNMNGEGSKMGFWSGSPESDGGSLFKFVGAEFENDNARYYQLSDFENTLEYQTAVTPEGTTVGAFINGDAYSTAYTTASDLITAGNTSDATACKDAYTALRTTSANVERIEPEAGKIYRIDITPTLDDSNRAGASMRIDDYGKLACGVNSAETADSHYYFTFEYDNDGNLYMKSLHTGTYLDEAHTTAIQLGADAETIDSAKKITINTLGKAGDAVVVSIVPDGGHMLNCAAKQGSVVAYNSSDVNKASAWVITEVSDSEEIKYATTISSRYKYSTLMLNYNAVVPEGVTAYAAVSNDNYYVYLESVGDIIPAKTAVILEAGDELEDYNVAFKYTTEEVEEVEGNMLEGVLWKQLIDIDPTARKAYMLMARSGVLKLYRVFSEYASTDGVNDTPTYSGTDNGTHTVCPANRAYLPVDKTNNAAALSFRFDWGGTTDIDEISGNKSGALDGTIYDLHGRKLEKVNVPGFYIVNGKKVFVSEVE